MVLSVHPKLFRALPTNPFTFQIPENVAGVALQYRSVEFRSTSDPDTPGVCRQILDPDPSAPSYNALSLTHIGEASTHALTVGAPAS